MFIYNDCFIDWEVGEFFVHILKAIEEIDFLFVKNSNDMI